MSKMQISYSLCQKCRLLFILRLDNLLLYLSCLFKRSVRKKEIKKRERERERENICVCVHACVRARVCVCVRARERDTHTEKKYSRYC